MNNIEDKTETDPELKERINQTMIGVAKIFVNDVVHGKKNLEEMINDIDNSEIPESAKKLIVFHMGLEMPTDIKKEK